MNVGVVSVHWSQEGQRHYLHSAIRCKLARMSTGISENTIGPGASLGMCVSRIVIGTGSLILVQMLRFHGSRGQTALIICQKAR